jgi:hypothetical protein
VKGKNSSAAEPGKAAAIESTAQEQCHSRKYRQTGSETAKRNSTRSRHRETRQQAFKAKRFASIKNFHIAGAILHL